MLPASAAKQYEQRAGCNNPERVLLMLKLWRSQARLALGNVRGAERDLTTLLAVEPDNAWSRLTDLRGGSSAVKTSGNGGN